MPVKENGARSQSALVRGVEKLSKLFTELMIAMCLLLFGVMVFSVTYGVIGRYIPGVSAPRWTQELAILCMVWICFLAAGYGIGYKLHVRLTLVVNMLPARIAKALHAFSYVLLFGVNAFWVKYGLEVVDMTARSRMPATGWPMYMIYLSVVVGGIYGMVMSLYRLTKGEW